MATSDSAPQKTSLLRHLARYGSANLLGILAGVISFPIMARLLSKSEFGLLGLFETAALIWTALLKMGLQNSIQRFYPIYATTPDPARRRAFYASLVQAPALISIGLCLAALGALPLAARLGLKKPGYLAIVLVLGELRVLAALIDNVIRAREESALAARLSVASRYLQTGLVLAVVIWLTPTALGVYSAQIASAGILLIYYFGWGRRHCEFGLRGFSGPMLREGLAYGLPLVWSELSLILLAFADRPLMQWLGCSMEELGVYTVGYSLAMIAGDFIMYSMLPAFQPIANRLYEMEGREAALRLQRGLLRGLYYAAAAIITGLALVGRDFLVLWAGPDKATSAPVFQWVGINYVVYPIFGVLAYGLNLTRRTRVIARVVLAAAGLNVVLNILLIPHLKIIGAVYATLASYLALGCALVACCPKDHRPLPSAGELIRPIGLALLMAGVAWGTGLFGADGPLARLIVMALVFVFTFILPMLALDGEIREKAWRAVPARFRGKA